MGLEHRRDSRVLEKFCRRAFESSTLQRYDQELKYWLAFINENGLHEFLWGLTKQQKVEEVAWFIYDLVDKQGRSGDQVNRILSSMQAYFATNCREISDVMGEQTVKLARKAASKQESGRALSEKREQKRRAPVTLHMLTQARTWYWKLGQKSMTLEELDSSMTYLALVLAFHFMWRASEYIFDSKCSKHAILNKDVLFVDHKEERYDREKLRRMFLGGGNVLVNKILFKVRSTKTERYGHTRFLVLKRGSKFETLLLTDILTWVKIAGCVCAEKPFLSRTAVGTNRQTRTRLLTRKEVSMALKDIAKKMGHTDVGFAFSPHSLRIGGASTMISKGASTEETRMIGGWAKDSQVAEIYWQYSPLEGGALSEYTHTLDVGDLPVTQFMVYDSKDEFSREHPGLGDWVDESARDHAAQA
jgi:site-specific recombinase XerD